MSAVLEAFTRELVLPSFWARPLLASVCSLTMFATDVKARIALDITKVGTNRKSTYFMRTGWLTMSHMQYMNTGL